MAERIGRKWVSPFSPFKNGFLVRFVVCASSFWHGQQSFTNLVVLCRTVIAYKSREVLNRDVVTLLCWWGNIHKFCVSDEVTSYSQSMYLTISVIIRACILLKIRVLSYRDVYISTGKCFLLVSTKWRNCRKTLDAAGDWHSCQILGAPFIPEINLLGRLGIYFMDRIAGNINTENML